MNRVALYCSFLIPLSAMATTWGELEVNDPILSGAKCTVNEPASWGGYIYRWPSKYDQVFWPLTDKHGIWYCEESGFTAFIGDFDDLSPVEIKVIKELLKSNALRSTEIEAKLVLMEKIYALRNKDAVFKNKLLRVLARWYQNLGKTEKANSYRKSALEDIEGKLNESLSEFQRLEYLYLAMNYSRQLGEPQKADKYLEELTSALNSVTGDEAKGYSKYLEEIIPDSKYINQDGAIDPELPL